ncbi:MAG: TolC family protein, partial [Flavobacterium sp.]
QIQVNKGNIPLKDVVRLKGAYLKLNNNRAELLQKYYETQANLQTLLQTTSIIEFQFSEQEIEKYIKPISLDEIKSEALLNRPELLIIQQNKILAEQYLQYQKRLAIPDINLFTSYDQRGGAFINQINAGVTIPLPLWNRNQGNIKSSQFKLKEAEYNLQAMQNEMISSLQNNYAFYLQTVSEYQKATSLYNQDFEITVKGMTDNFQKRNVSIVEFIDFFEAYNEALTELARIKTQLVVSGEQLNLLIGKDIY